MEQTLRYGPFGELLSSTGSSPNGLRFTGRDSDGETGLYYYRARYYDPEIGRFLSEDPLGFGAGGVNLYAYVENNPLLANDPLGRDGFFPDAKVYRFSGSWGAVVSPKSGVEIVINSESGEVSFFAYGGWKLGPRGRVLV